MARWLKLQLARQHGVCANVQFPFPEKFASDAFAAILGAAPDQSRFSREVLTWQLMRRLPTLLETPPSRRSRHYLRDRADTRRLFQFAARVANLFDQYLIFRPEMVREWDAGRDDHWQAKLWRAITDGAPLDHPAALQQNQQPSSAPAATADLAAHFAKANLPSRITIFGISALPPFHVHLFAALGQHLDVHLFLLQPSSEFWGDITTSREAGRVLRAQRRGRRRRGVSSRRGQPPARVDGQARPRFPGLIWEAGDCGPSTTVSSSRASHPAHGNPVGHSPLAQPRSRRHPSHGHPAGRRFPADPLVPQPAARDGGAARSSPRLVPARSDPHAARRAGDDAGHRKLRAVHPGGVRRARERSATHPVQPRRSQPAPAEPHHRHLPLAAQSRRLASAAPAVLALLEARAVRARFGSPRPTSK